MVTFYHGKDTEIEEICMPKLLFTADTNTKIPIAIDNSNRDERYAFRDIVDGREDENMEFLWEAFRIFQHWIFNAEYPETLSHTDDVYACILAEKLQSPHFGNAAMIEVLCAIASQVDDVNLKYNFREIFANCKDTSNIYRLYFECSVFWKLAFNNYPLPGEKLLGLDSAKDTSLIAALTAHKIDFCNCNFAHLAPELLYPELSVDFEELPVVPSNPSCKCQEAPWNDWIRFLTDD